MYYDADGNLLQSKDAAGNYISYTYDQDGRKTAQYAAPTGTGDQVPFGAPPARTRPPRGSTTTPTTRSPASTDPIGQATTETAYASGYAYTTQQLGFNVFGESTGEVVRPRRPAPPARAWAPPSRSPTPTSGDQRRRRPAVLPVRRRPAAPRPSPTPTPRRWTCPSAVGGAERLRRGHRLHRLRPARAGHPRRPGPTTRTVTDTYDPHTGDLTGQLVTRSTATPTRRRHHLRLQRRPAR